MKNFILKQLLTVTCTFYRLFYVRKPNEKRFLTNELLISVCSGRTWSQVGKPIQATPLPAVITRWRCRNVFTDSRSASSTYQETADVLMKHVSDVLKRSVKRNQTAVTVFLLENWETLVSMCGGNARCIQGFHLSESELYEY